ncbi:hypothetical protein ACHAXR_010448 [Thalassiosira sp. AJA248-18]
MLTGQTCEVKGFHNSFDAISNVPIATVATAWTNPQSGATYILIFNESLYFGEQMDHSLINPNQLRTCGLPVYGTILSPPITRLELSTGSCSYRSRQQGPLFSAQLTFPLTTKWNHANNSF